MKSHEERAREVWDDLESIPDYSPYDESKEWDAVAERDQVKIAAALKAVEDEAYARIEECWPSEKQILEDAITESAKLNYSDHRPLVKAAYVLGATTALAELRWKLKLEEAASRRNEE